MKRNNKSSEAVKKGTAVEDIQAILATGKTEQHLI